MLKYPEIDPVAISIGSVKIHWYALTYIAGLAIAWWLLRRRASRGHVTWQANSSEESVRDVEDIVFYSALGIVLGGRIGSMLFYNFDTFLQNPLELLKVWQGGMSFHGGLLGVLLAMALYAKSKGRTFFQMTDFIAPVVPVGLGLGRIGNFINGELWGKETTVPWGMEFKGVVRHPSMLYEAVLEGLVMFLVLWFYSRAGRPTRAISGLFLLLYGVFRFSVEFVRLPDGHIGYLLGGWLTMGQLLSAPMIVFGILLMFLAYREKTISAGGTA
ncbi:MAG: prolipoprotein diacylglyceryl transferase [Pseudomonadota bacterium]